MQTTCSREVGAFEERPLFDDFELIGEKDTREGETALERVLANGLEGFVADDAFEGGAIAENPLLDDCELIGESDTREGEACLECPPS